MSITHTAGPWFKHEGSIYSGVPTHKQRGYLAGYDKCICELDNMDIGPRKKMANARLISAAPDLLAALQSFVAEQQAHQGLVSVDTYAAAVLAVSKATGGAA